MTLSNPPSSAPWWKQGVVYQIYPRSFMDSNGDGVGDIPGIISKLDHLAGAPNSLGVDAVWLSPFYPSPMADFGYDVSDYCNVHPLFGDLADFDRFLAEAHKRNLKVIIDWVPNHTSDHHPWFVESREDRTNPKRDWYIWRDARSDGSLPNNWGSVFGGPAWEWDKNRKQYYLHQFLKEQPDLNWRNPEVYRAMLDTLRFWLDRGVDGFRMDVLGMIYKHPDLPDNPPRPVIPSNLPADDIFSRLINIYNQDQDDVHDVLRDIRRLLDSYGETCIIGEIWYELPRWVKYYGERGEGIHLPFNFRLINTPWDAMKVRQSVDELEDILPSFAWPNYVLGNHDQTRLSSKIGEQQTRVAAMLLLTLRGTSTLYYGDELAIPNGDIPIEKMQDPSGIRLGPERGRDICRTPMQWDNSPYAGFSTHEPWLPVSPDFTTRNVAHYDKIHTSLLNLYRYLLRLRKSTSALNTGSFKSIDAGNDDCYVYQRQDENGRYLVALNFSAAAHTLNIPRVSKGHVILSTHLDRAEQVSMKSLKLRPDEGVVISL